MLGASGLASFPLSAAGTLAVSIVAALLCKRRAGQARARGDCDGFLFWHSAWHYVLPLGATVGGQLLLSEGPWDPNPHHGWHGWGLGDPVCNAAMRTSTNLTATQSSIGTT